MKLSRRRLIALSAAGIAMPAAARSGFAQDYPSRPIRMNVGYPPGGAADLVARLVGQGLSARLGQPVVIENRPGSGANVAGEATAKAAPDGYTILHGTDNIFIANPHLYAKMTFDPLKDLVPVSSLTSNQLLLAVHPSVPARDLREFVELARKTRPPLFYASIGNGSQHHLAMEMLKQHAGIDLTHVPYRGGGPASIALLAGEISAMFGGGSLVPTIQSGKVRGLAATAATRFPLLPELPTIGEIYPDYEVLIWHGLFVPRGVPQPIIARLRAEVLEVLKQPDLIKRLAASGSGEPYISTLEEFNARIRADHAKYGKVIRAIGIKLD
ncbi:MAG: tripartite tricarboxylate transporter substrate binding protein [Hyphomicrobiales bacterium]|nr:tripartite tricarboxylate transporter substrate binding protein [Hyphomicrobiales bacterium]